MHDELYQRIELAHQKILEFGWHQREGLTTMYKHIKDMWNLLDAEMVECRRRNRPTQKYLELAKKIDEHLNTLEQYIVFGTLIKGE